jgi:hypothetical protein
MLQKDDGDDPWTTWTDNDILLVKNGKHIASQTNLVMGCLVRDIEKDIQFVMKKLSTIGKTFRHIHVIVMENNSKDGIRQILLSWAKKSPWKNISFVCVHPETFEINTSECHLTNISDDRHGVFHSRISRMAYLRNRLHRYVCKWLKANPIYDYVLYSDIDLHGIIYQRGLYHTFGCFDSDHDIQVIGFRGTTEKGWLWDSYAFERYSNRGDTCQLAMCKMTSGQIDISSSTRLVKVRCSFSGGTFIRARDMHEEFHYDAISVGSFVLCEHVPFYRNFEHVYINTNMIQTHTNHGDIDNNYS